MCIVTMNMGSFEIERHDSHHDRHEDERTGRHPTLELQHGRTGINPMPQDLTSVDAELFMQRMYTYRQQ